MKKTPHPDRSLEAANLRDELSDQPDALRSLDALAREETSDDPIPPIPDDLRDQWQDRYGAARQPVTEEKKSWLSKISSLWMYGGATALAAIAIFIALKDDSPVTPGGNNPPPTMRGGNDFEVTTAHPIVFIPSESISFEAFVSTRSANSTLQATDLDDAVQLLTERNIPSASILSASDAALFEWSGQLQKGLQLFEINPSTDEYDLSEALDEYLDQ